ncbi:MAG: CBS domain-containing protein [Thermoleophilia bacterium]|nr:CBS domain-containing protein [Thermoleophilia bacterium]
MRSLRELPLRQSAVPRTATFEEAAEALVASGLAAIAVLDEHRRVVGLFTDDDLVRGLFPAYLGELRHTAFALDDERELAARLTAVGRAPVERHMRKPLTLEADTSATHAAERFLHCDWGALAVVERGLFLGMVSETEFARLLLDRLRREPPGQRG